MSFLSLYICLQLKYLTYIIICLKFLEVEVFDLNSLKDMMQGTLMELLVFGDLALPYLNRGQAI